MLTIRLQRTGKRNRPDFRLILAQKTAASGKKFQEILGSYNPRTKSFEVKDKERLNGWISKHVEISATAHNLLVTHGFITESKVKAFSIPTKVKKKAEEAKAKAEAEEAKAAAAPVAEDKPEEAQAESSEPALEAKEENKEEVAEATPAAE